MMTFQKFFPYNLVVKNNRIQEEETNYSIEKEVNDKIEEEEDVNNRIDMTEEHSYR